MLAVARRSPLASGPGATWLAASRRCSLWPSRSLHAGRWLPTTTSHGDGHDDTTTNNKHDAATTRETLAQKNAREFALLPALLRIYEQHAGHRVVPYHFVIPPTDDTTVTAEMPPTKVRKRPTRVLGRVSDVRDIPWPEEARGMNFGRVLDKFVRSPKHYETYPWVTSDLNAMGIPVGDAYRAFVWEKQTMTPLRTFFQIHGHTLVPQDFEVPRGDSQWPVATWGYYLGIRVSNLRVCKHQLNEADLADLESVEFSFNSTETMWSDHIVPSFETYVRVYGNCRIPQTFQVPRAAPWPQKAWGLLLGNVVRGIRSNGTYAAQIERDRQRLEAIGFVWDYDEHSWSEIILPSLEEFYRIHNHSLVPRDFIVPAKTPWPREAWEFKLSLCVNNIRSRGDYSAQTKRDSARLEAIGFAWNHREHQWTHRFLPAIETFHHLHGHTRVPNKFVIPSASPWAEKVWGLPLGTMSLRIRRNGAYSEYMERDAERLAAIGFTVERSSVDVKSDRDADQDNQE